MDFNSGPPKSGPERIKWYKELKRAKDRERKAKKAQEMAKPEPKPKVYSTNPAAVWIRKSREKKKIEQQKLEEKREKDRLRKRNENRKRNCPSTFTSGSASIESPKSAFNNKFSKYRAMKNVSKAMPKTPSKQKTAEIIAQTIKKCPRTRQNLVSRGLVYSEAEQEKNRINASIVKNMSANFGNLRRITERFTMLVYNLHHQKTIQKMHHFKKLVQPLEWDAMHCQNQRANPFWQ